MKPKAGHTTFYKGKRISVLLRNGTIIEGRFGEKKGNYIILLDGRKARNEDVKNISISKSIKITQINKESL